MPQERQISCLFTSKSHRRREAKPLDHFRLLNPERVPLTDGANSRPEPVLHGNLGNVFFSFPVYTRWKEVGGDIECQKTTSAVGGNTLFFPWPSITHPSGLESDFTCLRRHALTPSLFRCPISSHSLLEISIPLCDSHYKLHSHHPPTLRTCPSPC